MSSDNCKKRFLFMFHCRHLARTPQNSPNDPFFLARDRDCVDKSLLIHRSYKKCHYHPTLGHSGLKTVLKELNLFLISLPSMSHRWGTGYDLYQTCVTSSGRLPCEDCNFECGYNEHFRHHMKTSHREMWRLNLVYTV